jgi:hypothetical protein
MRKLNKIGGIRHIRLCLMIGVCMAYREVIHLGEIPSKANSTSRLPNRSRGTSICLRRV